jgi:hypothetical protein
MHHYRHSQGVYRILKDPNWLNTMGKKSSIPAADVRILTG